MPCDNNISAWAEKFILILLCNIAYFMQYDWFIEMSAQNNQPHRNLYIIWKKKKKIFFFFCWKTSVEQNKYHMSLTVNLITICFYMTLEIFFYFMRLNSYNMIRRNC